MELLVAGALLLAAVGIGYGAANATRSAPPASPPVPRRPAVRSGPTWRKRRRRLNLLARHLQLALLQLQRTPDFRRAALFAAQAQAVPAAFRSRQYRRFRPALVQHYGRCLSAGQDDRLLLESLRDLLGSLGVSAFEADYIRGEAQRRAPQPTVQARPTYEQRVAVLQRSHDERLAAIQGLPSLDQETREQLLEAEESRYRQGLLDLANQDGDRAAG